MLYQPNPPNKRTDRLFRLYLRHKRTVSLALVLLMVVVLAATASAQTATPPPIEIPTSDMITNLNTWLGVFAPIILFIGMIPVALGLLQYLVGMFQRAFRGGR